MTITLTREEAQQVLGYLEEIHPGNMTPMAEINWNKAIETLRARLSAPEPEPVAVWELQEDGWDTIADQDWMESLPIGTKLYTAPPQRNIEFLKLPRECKILDDGAVLLPQREWQGLTDEEVEQIVDAYWEDPSMFIEAIEAKLKEKNNA
jgi:hypothetical protein